MRWVRTNRRFGAVCALVAIALQIVLSFGHAHRTEGFRPGPSSAAVTAGLRVAVTPNGTTTDAVLERRDPAPAPQDGATFEYCALCAVIEMASVAVPAQVPAWGLPDLPGGVFFAAVADAVPVTAQHRLFQARAPPQAV